MWLLWGESASRSLGQFLYAVAVDMALRMLPGESSLSWLCMALAAPWQESLVNQPSCRRSTAAASEGPAEQPWGTWMCCVRTAVTQWGMQARGSTSAVSVYKPEWELPASAVRAAVPSPCPLRWHPSSETWFLPPSVPLCTDGWVLCALLGSWGLSGHCLLGEHLGLAQRLGHSCTQMLLTGPCCSTPAQKFLTWEKVAPKSAFHSFLLNFLSVLQILPWDLNLKYWYFEQLLKNWGWMLVEQQWVCRLGYINSTMELNYSINRAILNILQHCTPASDCDARPGLWIHRPCAHSCENDRTARARFEDSVSFHLIRSVAGLSFTSECYTHSVLWGCPGVSASSRVWENLPPEWEFLEFMQRNLLLLGLSLAMTCQGDSSGFLSAWEVHYLTLVFQAFQFFFLLSFLPSLCSSLFFIG